MKKGGHKKILRHQSFGRNILINKLQCRHVRQYFGYTLNWYYLPRSGGPNANDGGPPPGPLVNSGRLNTLFGSRVAVMIWKRCFCVNLIDPHVSWS